jgi:acyl-CoA thioesterase FadM
MIVHVDLETDRAIVIPDDVREAFAAYADPP